MSAGFFLFFSSFLLSLSSRGTTSPSISPCKPDIPIDKDFIDIVTPDIVVKFYPWLSLSCKVPAGEPAPRGISPVRQLFEVQFDQTISVSSFDACSARRNCPPGTITAETLRRLWRLEVFSHSPPRAEFLPLSLIPTLSIDTQLNTPPPPPSSPLSSNSCAFQIIPGTIIQTAFTISNKTVTRKAGRNYPPSHPIT